MAAPYPSVALILPPVPAYSRGVTEGVIEFHATKRPWNLIDLPHWKAGRSPLPSGGVRLDGAIVWADRDDRWIEQLVASGVRVVNCGSAWTGVPGIATVRGDRRDYDRKVVEHFVGLGFTRVAMVCYQLERRPVLRALCDEFSRMARRHGLEVEAWSLGGRDNPDESPRRILNAEKEHELAEFLVRLPKPSAVYCENDHVAAIVVRVARHLELRVPEDLAIAGFGENLVARFSEPPLTSLSPPTKAIGRTAARTLEKWLKGEAPTPDQQIAGATLVQRESTIGTAGSVDLERVRRRIALHACDGITVNDLVAISGKSFKTLIRRYTEAYGIDPLDEIRERRMERARQLLSGGDLSISEIAGNCGFSSQAGFYNYFLRHAGCSPSEFRKRERPRPA